MGAEVAHRLALVMIVKNEARSLARCLQSVQGVVDECIVLDTGSSDDTVAIAQAHGARVGHFQWVDDFAAARNAALAMSSAAWNLVLDGDEWLAHGHEALHALRQQTPDTLGLVEVASPFDEHGQTASSWIPRLLPAGVRYTGRIHEQPEFKGPRQQLAVRVAHDGYLPAQRARKADRNQHLLTLALQEHPNDAYLHYQLGKDHEVNDRFQPAWVAYTAALSLLGPHASREPAWRHDLILRTLFALKADGRVPEAIDLAQAEMPHWHDSPDFYFVLGDVLLDHAVAHPEQAAELVPMIEAAWRQCLAIGENPGLEGAVAGRGSVLAEKQLHLLQDVVAALG